MGWMGIVDHIGWLVMLRDDLLIGDGAVLAGAAACILIDRSCVV